MHMRAFVAAGLLVLGLAACGGPSPPPESTDATVITSDGIGTRVTVTGRLTAVGGPAPGASRAWPGTVSWRGPTDGTVRTDSSGVFHLRIPPGRYLVTGHSPRYDGGAALCQAPGALVVRRGEAVRVDVVCRLR
jgi:hypothetical protein